MDSVSQTCSNPLREFGVVLGETWRDYSALVDSSRTGSNARISAMLLRKKGLSAATLLAVHFQDAGDKT